MKRQHAAWLCAMFTITSMGAIACAPDVRAVPEYRSASDMNELVQNIESRIDAFARSKYPKLPSARFHVVKPGEHVQSYCTNSSNPPSTNNVMFCPSDNVIYVGESILWDQYQRFGEIAVQIMTAHEWGHFVQNMYGITLVPYYPANERQADCIAGAWKAFDSDSTQLDTDTQERIKAMFSITENGTSPDIYRSRVWSFNEGLNYGLKACDYFGLGSVTR